MTAEGARAQVAAPTVPYVGPRPYEERERELFFGREREADELFSLTVAHPLVLAYGPSGSGKTSLLSAGVVPLLRDEGFEALLGARMSAPASLHLDVESRYAQSTLRAWADGLNVPESERSDSLPAFLAQNVRAKAGKSRPVVAIFDQFEEFFAAGSALQSERLEFVRQLRNALNDPLFRVVISMREDSIAQLHPFIKLLPGNLSIRFRLERLRSAEALAAVAGPLQKAGRGRRFAPGVAEQLVDELSRERVETSPGQFEEVPGEFVEPVQLQVVCESLWRRLPEATKIISESDLERIGDVTEALSKFYEDSIKAVAKDGGRGEGELRRWFETVLITGAGTRGTVFRGQEQTGGLPNQLLDALEQKHLIRTELRAGGRWYELSHDTFIWPIQESNREWRMRLPKAEQLRQKLELRADEWAKHGRGERLLLQEAELEEAAAWLASPISIELGQKENVIALVEASHSRQNRRRQELEGERKRRQLAWWKGASLSLLFSLGFACVAVVVAIVQWRAASTSLAAEKAARSSEAKANDDAAKQRQTAAAAQASAAAGVIQAVQLQKQLVSTDDALRVEQKQKDEILKRAPVLAATAAVHATHSEQVLGTDVTHYAGNVDWAKMKAGGIVFSYVKATEGSVFADEAFERNWAALKHAGVLRGAYHFFRAQQDVAAQARLFLSTMGKLDDDDLPPVLDLEVFDGVAPNTVVTLAKTWLETVARESKRRPVLYSSSVVRVESQDLAEYPLWTMAWGPTPVLPAPTWKTWTFWQFTSTGTIAGVPGRFDLNRFNGSEEALKAFVRASKIGP